jgi:hemoglobin-like flavoprotein
MTPDQIRLVISSIEALRPRSDEFASLFYEELFALEPDARDLFPEDMTLQRVKLFKELDEIAHAIPTLDAFVVRAQHLGSEHAGFGVERKHYLAFGTVLLPALAEILGDDFTPEVAEAWRVAYGLVSDSMQRGAFELERGPESRP